MKKHLPTHLLLFFFLYLGTLGRAVAQYCVPTHPSGCGNGDITLVRITGTTLNNVSSCGNGGYTVWPAQGSTTAVLRQNSGYAFNVTSSGSYVTVWVDWDQSQSFDNTETLIYGLSSPVASGFIVPSSARTGQTRMRVRSRQTSSTIAACGSQASGETEDYIVTVVAGQSPAVCLPFNYSACSDGNITRVTLTGTGLDNVSTCSTDSAGNAYTIWPKQGSRTGVVRQGQTYSMDIAAGNAYVGLWVDWDQSNSFESTEQILFGPNAPVNYWLSVPANAVTGTTRMRIRTRTNSSTINPCGLSATGETEDYFLTVIAGQSPIPCTPGHYNGCGNGNITRVQILGSGLDKSSNCSTDTAGNAYTVWPATGNQTGTVRMGSTYAFKVNAGNTYVGAWADWDQSGTFETSEQIFYGANAPVAGYLAVPANARAGQVRLRIRSRTSSSSLDACTNYSNGEAEDYFLTVLPGSAPVPCTPGHYSGCAGGAITRVKITGTTLDNSSACTEDSAGNAYTIWPATGTKTGMLRQGTAYAFSISAGVSYIGVWADWNQNDVFETSEQIVYGASSPFAGYLPVPDNATLGRIRLRVRSYQSSSSLSACANYGSGEAEDYFVTVLPGIPPAICTPWNFSGCSSAWITRVKLTGTSLDNTSACSTDTTGNAYTVWPATGNRTATVRQGTSYAFLVTAPGADIFVWADWNGNNVFETSEYLIAANTPVVTYLTVPTDAAVGQVRLRIRSSGTTSSLSACGYTSTGEAEDYLLTVVPGTAPTPCTPGHFSGCSSTGAITGVKIVGTTLENSSTCSSDSAGNNYTVWPAIGSRTGIVRQGTTYAFQATAQGANIFVWADWNGNNIFESYEFLIQSTSPVASYIAVPTDAALGLVRIRVRSSLSAAGLSSCGFTSSGEAEDYFVTVVAGQSPLPCVPGQYTGCGSGGDITNVQVVGTTLNNSSTCSVDSTGNAYTVWPATGNRTGLLRQGTTYGFKVTGAYISVWVDWNQNNVFESSEYMISGGWPLVSALQVPANAPLGLVRMRIRSTTSSFSVTPCNIANYGETEDYFMTVIPGQAPSPCTPGNYYGCGTNSITSVNLVGTSLNNTSTCSVDSTGNAYTVWPATGNQTGIVRQGTTYGFRAAASGAYVSVWADWNQNNSFDNGEYMISGLSPVVSYITIPTTATLGLTRIRVRSYVRTGSMAPCNFYDSGETEDYFITVVAGQAPIPCSPGNYAGCNNNITSVSLIGTTLTNTSTCIPDSTGNAYIVWPATGTRTGIVRQGSTYGFRATAEVGYVTVWADWNQNQVFEDTEYLIFMATPVRGSISIPTNARLGLTRIRVRSYGRSTALTPCGIYESGETEDYFVTVVEGQAPVPCTPQNYAGCGTSYISRVAMSGSGLDQSSTCSEDTTGNAYKTWPINGSSTGTLRQNQSYTFTATTAATGWLSAWIDWNQDGSFDLSEQIGGANTGTLTRTVTIPANAPSGYARMRVRSSSTGSISSSCNWVNAGETEDFWLAVVNGPICNTGVFSYNTPGVLCAGSNVVLTPQFTVFSSAANFSATPAGLALNATTGEVQVQNSQPGTYTVRNIVTAAGNCSADTGYATVSIVAQASAGFTYGQNTYCRTSGSDPVPTITGTPGGAFSAGTGLAINAQTGRISLANSVAGSYTVRYDITGTCAASSSVNIILIDPATANFVLADSLCTSGSTFTIQMSAGATRGVFSAVPAGLSMTAGGTVNLAASQPGQYTITNTVTGTAGCADATDTQLLTVVGQSTATFSYGSNSYCRSVASASPTVTGTAGGRFSATPAGLSLNAATGEINPASSTVGTYSVRYQVGGLCPSSSSANVTITSASGSTFTIPATACTYDGNILAQPGAGSVRGVFSAQPNGLSIDANGSISPSTSVPGRYVVSNTVAGGTGCPNSVSTDTIEVFAEPTVTISVIGSESFCQGDSAKLVASGANSYVWSTGAITPTIIVHTTGAYQVQGRGAGGCVGIRGQRIDVFTRPATPVITLTGGGTSLTSNATTGNQWLLNGQPISGATGQTYTIPANGSGTYSAVVVSGTGCDSDTSNSIVVVVSRITGRERGEWRFHPNPSEGRLLLTPPTRMEGELVLYDALGRVTYREMLAGQEVYELHLEHLPKGVYQARIRTATGMHTHRVTLQ